MILRKAKMRFGYNPSEPELGLHWHDVAPLSGISPALYAERMPAPLERVNNYVYHESEYPSVTKIDWLRVTCKGADVAFWVINEMADLFGGRTDIELRAQDKGLLGYSRGFSLVLASDYGELSKVGAIVYEPNPNSGNAGVMVDLSGVACSYLQLTYPDVWRDMCQFFADYGFRITRCDIALDLSGDFCRDRGLTVPVVLDAGVKRGLFASGNHRNGQAVTVKTAGDWSSIIVGDVTTASYDPSKHALDGLTAYFGSRKSPIFIRAYEKGKQLLGMSAENDPTIDQWWLRIEQERKRDKDGNDLPFDMCFDPDAYFVANRPGMADLLNDYLSFLGSGAVVKYAKFAAYKRERNLSVARKVFWACRSYGRLLRTLADKTGMTAEELYPLLSREVGLKDYIFDVVFPVAEELNDG